VATDSPSIGSPSIDSPSIRSRAGRQVAWSLAPVGGLIFVGLIWWLAVSVLNVKAFLLPSPSSVLDAFTAAPVYLLQQTWVTTLESLEGFGLAVVVGVLLGAFLASSRLLRGTFLPLLVAVNAAPKVALVPLMTAWLGFGTTPKLVMAFLLAVFPVVMATSTGLGSTPEDFLELGRSLSASWLKSFVRLRLPHALASMFSGFQIAMPLAVVGAIIGELGNASSGLGYVLAQAAGGGEIPLAFASFVLCAIMGIVLYYAVAGIQWLALPWARQSAGR
jgi:NitT/TauT family transport system permease protein